MRCNQLQPPENVEGEEQQLQAALAAPREGTSVHEDQTSGSGAAAAPDDLVEAVAPIVRRGQTSASGAAVARCCILRPRCTRAWAACQSGRTHPGVEGVDVAQNA